MNSDSFRHALGRCGISQVAAAKLFDVNERTVRRWASGEDSVPKAVQIALVLMLKLGISVDGVEKIIRR